MVQCSLPYCSILCRPGFGKRKELKINGRAGQDEFLQIILEQRDRIPQRPYFARRFGRFNALSEPDIRRLTSVFAAVTAAAKVGCRRGAKRASHTLWPRNVKI